jgi:hypothetical protein
METTLNKIMPLMVGAALAAAPLAAQAQDATTPPAPSPELSAICTDRPTKSNVPCTVDAGHFQVESDLFNGTFQKVGGVTTDTYLVTNPTLKYGVTKTLDLEVNLASGPPASSPM